MMNALRKNLQRPQYSFTAAGIILWGTAQLAIRYDVGMVPPIVETIGIVLAVIGSVTYFLRK